MERTPHVMLVGDGATNFAIAQGMPRENLLTPEAESSYLEWKRSCSDGKGHDTLGFSRWMVRAISPLQVTHERIWRASLPGRVGDSPIIGAGFML